jgi:hypothetical protein
MPIIKISKGEVILKDVCTRKVKKDIIAALFQDGKVSPQSIDKGNDVAMLGLIQKITIDGQEMPLTVETLDAMDVKDVNLIIEEINKITDKPLPNF